MRKGLVALALLFLAAHLPFLPPSLEDLDSINFALGVQHFDVAQHRPHPPGYPVFIAMSKASTRVLRAAGVRSPEVRGLAVWSAIGGALTILFAGMFFGAVARDGRLGLLTAVLMASAPLFWFTALRPLSDMIGLAAAFASLAALATAMPPAALGPAGAPEQSEAAAASPRALIVGALLAGLAIGIRSQTFVMTLPLAAFVLLATWKALATRTRVTVLAAAAAGVAAWAVPLVTASGGPAAYLKALGSQGAEDFSGVVMLSAHRTVRVAAEAALNTFVLPWDSLVLAGIVLVLAVAGGLALAWRSPRTALVLGLVFVPYAVFHLLFHEVVTGRYALPLVPLIAFLAVVALAAIHRRAAAAGAIVLAAGGVILAAQPSARFGAERSPVSRLLSDMNAQAQGVQPLIAMHRREFTETRRPREWAGGLPGRLLPAPRDYEWLEATRAWREGTPSPVWFVADPKRSDLALIDRRGSRTLEYRWPFDAAVYLGGARPNEMDWHVYTNPGWFLEHGWAITAEAGGITERDGWGPHRRPSEGWVRRDIGDGTMLIGGRHLGGPTDPRVRVVVSLDGRPVLTDEVTPGFFVAIEPLPPGALTGEGTLAALTVRAEPLNSGAVPARVSLEQFDVQPRGIPMLAFEEGWNEPEYNPITGRTWRWMSERAVLRIVNASGDVTLRMAGENPRRYYRSAPALRVSAGDAFEKQFTPDADFSYVVSVPAAALAASGDRVTLESSLSFIPAERGGAADRRHLAIRMYSVSVDR